MSTALRRDVSGEDIEEQVRTARDEIREVFFAAGMGITGANALIAETGTVMMVTNEGNGRLCSSVPPVHVVLAGIEKLIPTFDDAVTQLRLLARSGTAQRITSYTTFITGPDAGPRDAHRSGRQRPADDGGHSRVRRGAALHPLCRLRQRLPTVPGGRRPRLWPHLHRRDRAGRDRFHHGLEAAAGPQSLCLSCNACETVCPAGIPLPRQILDVRKMVVERQGAQADGPGSLCPAQSSRSGVEDRSPPATAGRSRRSPLRARRVPVLRGQTRWRSLPALAVRLCGPIPARGVLASGTPVVANGAAGCR